MITIDWLAAIRRTRKLIKTLTNLLDSFLDFIGPTTVDGDLTSADRIVCIVAANIIVSMESKPVYSRV